MDPRARVRRTGDNPFMFTIAQEKFSGPLALLLELIEQEKLEISEVALGQVTESYLRYLEANPGLPPEELVDFLVIASKLLLLKSKTLLPELAVAEEGEQNLESQLKIYREYLEASKAIAKALGARRTLYVREKAPAMPRFSPPPLVDAGVLYDLFSGLVHRLAPAPLAPRAAFERAVSLHEKIRELQALLGGSTKTTFRAFLATASSRAEIIVSFLALLELVKQRNAAVVQDDHFADIAIVPHGV